jgi:hypothetical protein
VGWSLTLGFLAAAGGSAAYVFSHKLPIPGVALEAALDRFRGAATRAPASTETKGKKGVAKKDARAPLPTVTEKATETLSEMGANLGGKVILAVEGVQTKAVEVGDAIEENERLRLENANLRRWAQALRFECDSHKSEEATRGLAGVAVEKTGADVGRALASIRYTPPAHLLPSQLQILGMTYFEAKEYEKSAVIFTFLSEMEGGGDYRTARGFLLAGASWYRLSNYKMADHYFERVLALKPEPEALPYQAQARLWRALTANKTKDHGKTQHWLRELVDYHPQSTEAGWINPAAADRVPSAAEILGRSKLHEGSAKRQKRNIHYE